MKSNILNLIKKDLKSMTRDVKDFKSLYKNDSAKANFIVRQILSDLNFSTISNNDLIHSRIIGNHLYTVSFCPQYEFELPKKFMFDDAKKTRISNPTIYESGNKLLEIKDILKKEYISSEKIESIEIPISITAHEVKKGIVFGDYKGYYNTFLVDKALNNKNIPDELDILVIKTLLNKNDNVYIDKNSVSDYKRKVFTTWANTSQEFNCSFFETKGVIFNQLVKNLIRSLKIKDQEVKKVS